ncbi:hypothetical protein ABEB36_013331 [Hypothenemus hampei]|uniref:Uncharacterized protein n=1 Tax=Hypothenemus hampei TaxID=57062 RepID=A0ABD1E8E1_HYPHA
MRTRFFLNSKNSNHKTPTRTEEYIINVFVYVAVKPQTSIWTIAEELDLNKSTVQRILRARYDRRIWNVDWNLLLACSCILWSDESRFYNNEGVKMRHNDSL